MPGTTAASASGRPVPYSWQNVPIVAGGFVDGLVFSPAQPGLAYARTDIGGAYRWDAAARRWIPLLDFTGFNAWSEIGVQSVAADPGNPARVWVATGEYTQPWAVPPDGEILRSDNQGRTWRTASGTNLYRSTDAGATWHAVPGEPTGMEPQRGVLASSGVLYVDYANQPGPNGMTDGSVWKYDTAAANGIEETAVQDLLSPAAGPCRLISAVGDLGGFCHTRLTVSPAAGMIQPILSTGTSLAEAGARPLDIAPVGWSGGDFSADGGTWAKMTLPAGEPYGAGVVALAADGTSMVWTPENQSYAPEPGTPVFSADQGETWTADGGKAFAADTSVGTVATLGFGKAAPGARYPAIYLTGAIGGVQGVFRSIDAGTGWVQINDTAHQYGWIGQAITGDPDTFGRVYLGTNGRGIVYADPAGGTW